MGTVHPPAIFISLFCSSYPPGSVQGGDRESAKKPEARARLSAHPFLQQREPSPSLRAKEGSSGWRGSLQSEAGWMQAVLAPNFPLCPLGESFLRRLFAVLGGAQDWESEDIGSVPSSATKKLGSSARPLSLPGPRFLRLESLDPQVHSHILHRFPELCRSFHLLPVSLPVPAMPSTPNSQMFLTDPDPARI